MTRGEFERRVEQAIGAIPRVFRERVDNLSFLVRDWADGETLAEVGLDDPLELLGYYCGWPLTERSHDYVSVPPDVIIIFQGAVENYIVETGEPLDKVLHETIIHELGHYFGFSEEQMDEIEALWQQRADGRDEDQP